MIPSLIALACYGMFAGTFAVAACVIVHDIRKALPLIRRALSQP